MKKEKKLYLEIMRILAALFVIFNHTGEYGFFLYQWYPSGSLKYWIYLFCSIFCQFAVPLFFAISGALLIPHFEETLLVLWKKRILKMACILTVFSAIYGAMSSYLDGGGESILQLKTLIATMYRKPIGYHLWYLYAYIAFLVGLPFLRLMCRNIDGKIFGYLVCISVVVNLIPVLEYLVYKQKYVIYEPLLPSWLTSNIVLYPIAGYYMEEKIDIQKMKKWILPMWVVNIGFILLSGYATMIRGNDMGEINEEVSQVFYKNFALVNCMTIYLSVKWLFTQIHKNEKLLHIVQTTGSCTFGIYLFHIIAMRIPISIEVRDSILKTGIHPMVGIWIYVFGIASVCFTVTYVLRKIPGVKMLLGG